MEKPTFPELTFTNVTPQAIGRLKHFLEDEPGGGVDSGDSGLAETSCFTAKFDFDPHTGVLKLEPIHLVEGLRGRRLAKIVDSLMTSDPAVIRLSDTGDPEPEPYSCATYNWAVGFMTNNTNYTLTGGTPTTDHGILQSQMGKIAPGSTPSAQGDDGIFKNKALKDSTVGCGGSVKWTIEGTTTITISYYINTSVTYSATPSLDGPNASLYTATCEARHHYAKATDYLYPTVTLGNA